MSGPFIHRVSPPRGGEFSIATTGEFIIGDDIDRFHIMGHMGKAVDTVRKQEHRTRKAAGDDVLTGTKSLWL